MLRSKGSFKAFAMIVLKSDVGFRWLGLKYALDFDYEVAFERHYDKIIIIGE